MGMYSSSNHTTETYDIPIDDGRGYRCRYCDKQMEFDDGWCSMHCNAMWNIKRIKK